MYYTDDGTHRLIVTLLDGAERLSPDQFDGHCACHRWSWRTGEWAELGARWAWHCVAESERPDNHPLIRQAVKAELQAFDDYGGGCEGCGFPLVKGRSRCRSCQETEGAEPRAVDTPKGA
ncbi:MAG: hypothetical protein F4152_08210 [Dehalococcoidia bacterium]|nr:hypothetical protein [Dehalococcoidia bacterium]